MGRFPPTYAAPELVVEIDDRRRRVHRHPIHTNDEESEGSGQGGAPIHGKDASHWIGELPADGVPQ